MNRPPSRNCKAKNSPNGGRACKGDFGMGEDVVTWKLYLGLAFTIPTLERVTIGFCEVDGGGGGGEVFGGGVFGCSVVFSGDGVGNGVGGVVCVVACQDIDIGNDCKGTRERWCGTRGKFVRWKGVRVTKASKRAKMGVRGFELQCHRGDQGVDAKGNDYWMVERDRNAVIPYVSEYHEKNAMVLYQQHGSLGEVRWWMVVGGGGCVVVVVEVGGFWRWWVGLVIYDGGGRGWWWRRCLVVIVVGRLGDGDDDCGGGNETKMIMGRISILKTLLEM
nr:DNA glycosylase [Tanacetum cinerariifolium]GEX75945.1 DNA glycosylase [Tanacetum cinerariifolium]